MKILLNAAVSAVLFVTFSVGANAQGDLDCSDFRNWREAQEFYEANGPGDPHGLDRDRDGIACESLD